MESEIFRAGVTPGSPGTEDEIKMLLCYVLTAVNAPMSFEQLFEALGEHALVNYFELVRLLDRLVELEHIEVSQSESGGEAYRAAKLGREAARAFEKTLPLSVREKAVSSANRVLARQKRRGEVRVVRTPVEQGFLLEFSIPDRTQDLVSLKVFAPTKEECDRLERRFLNAPLTVYKGVMALLTGEEKILGTIFTKEEKLF